LINFVYLLLYKYFTGYYDNQIPQNTNYIGSNNQNPYSHLLTNTSTGNQNINPLTSQNVSYPQYTTNPQNYNPNMQSPYSNITQPQQYSGTYNMAAGFPSINNIQNHPGKKLIILYHYFINLRCFVYNSNFINKQFFNY